MLPTIPTQAGVDAGVTGGGAAPVTVRQWNDDNSELRVPVVAASDATSEITVAVLVKPGAKSAFEAFMAARDSSGAVLWEFGTNASNIPFFYIASGGTTTVPSSGGTLTAATEYIVVYSHSVAGSVRRFHIFPLGGAWQHIAGDLGGGAPAAASSAGGYVSFGDDGTGSDLLGAVGVAGIWKTALSDAQVEALAAGLATAAWTGHAVAAGGVWRFNQASVSDAVPDLKANHVDISGTITGATDLNGIAGTTIVSDSFGTWAF